MSTLRLTTISNQSGSSSVPADTVISGSAKAWVNFNGTGTVAIRASFNVSSITDNGTGDYTTNFTVAMVDSSYSTQLTSSGPTLTGGGNTFLTTSGAAPTVSTTRFTCRNDAATLVDVEAAYVAIFR